MRKISIIVLLTTFLALTNIYAEEAPNKEPEMVGAPGYDYPKTMHDFLEKSSGKPVIEATVASVESLNLEKRLFMTLSVDKADVRVNDQITIVVKFYVNNLQMTGIHRPTLSHNDLSEPRFGEPKQYREERNGIKYDVLEFTTLLSGSKPGRYALGPATDKCNIIIKKTDSAGSFSYEIQPVDLKSQDIEITVSP